MPSGGPGSLARKTVVWAGESVGLRFAEPTLRTPNTEHIW